MIWLVLIKQIVENKMCGINSFKKIMKYLLAVLWNTRLGLFLQKWQRLVLDAFK